MTNALASHPPRLGIFDGHGDIGSPKIPGSATYDATTGVYIFTAAGVNMWGKRDECHMAWIRVAGNFALDARVEMAGLCEEKHRKAGCIARASLDDDAAYVDTALHAGDGLTAIQFRRTRGDITAHNVAPITFADTIRFERIGNRYRFLAARGDGPFAEADVTDLVLGDTIYVGLFLCSHNEDLVERATFHDVRLTRSSPASA